MFKIKNLSIISLTGGETMDIEKFCKILFDLYSEQENLNIEYELIFLDDKVSNC